MITVKIDVTKIDKKRLFEGKNGAKYLDIVLLDSQNDKYGNDYMVIQQVSKEEREKGVKGTILGNGKIVGGTNSQQNSGQANAESSSGNSSMDDLPF